MGAISLSVLRRRERLRRLVLLATLIAIGSVVLGIGYLFIARALEISRLEAQLRQLDLREQQLLQERAELEKLLAKRFDNEYMEYLARKQLGLIRPGEEKYIIVWEE
ncbi:MAG: septum formation initiator family protein [Candidatus Acetothermia bacterium]|jgi:cell division protein FtsB|nr:septum formation initiator family protein [Candidatus Acetothermia bacterium]MDH7505054.1 septum formation initiator family protein [Candidatus Acetothermia bacterium]